MLKKLKSGAKKHGGLLKAVAKETNKFGHGLDDALGKPSALASSIPEKRKDSENGFKDVAHVLTGGIAYPGREEEAVEPAVPAPLPSIEGPVQQAVLEVPILAATPAPLLPAGELEAAYLEVKEPILDGDKDINVREQDLSSALLSYLRQESVADEVFGDVAPMLMREKLSNAEAASKVLAYGDKGINTQVKSWVMQHISKSSETSVLLKIAGKHIIVHIKDSEFMTSITDALTSSGDEDITILASALFAMNYPELSSEIAAHLIGAEEEAVLESVFE